MQCCKISNSVHFALYRPRSEAINATSKSALLLRGQVCFTPPYPQSPAMKSVWIEDYRQRSQGKLTFCDDRRNGKASLGPKGEAGD